MSNIHRLKFHIKNYSGSNKFVTTYCIDKIESIKEAFIYIHNFIERRGMKVSDISKAYYNGKLIHIPVPENE